MNSTHANAPKPSANEPRDDAATPMEPARLIYADPPWDIQQRGALGADQHYDLMTTERISAMSEAVRALSAPDCVLLLWVTNAALAEGIEVLRSWGFRYVTNAAWDKYYMGLGQYFRNSHELLLLGVRGRVKPKFRGQKSIFHFPRMAHSVKPDEMYPLIERLFDGPYLELFARQRPNSRSAWRIWGDQVNADVSLAPWGYPVPSDFARQDSGDRTSDDQSSGSDPDSGIHN